MEAPHTNITAAHSWLHAMGDAASELGVTVQYCLVEPATVLASASIPAVTNIRASGDYHPGDYHDSVNHWNTWDVALTSIFFGALGVQPSKDVFWTTTLQPGNPFSKSPSGDTEPNPFLHALVATLSTGPVGFGDGLGYTNASLVMRACRAGDGLLLKPDRPSHAVPASLNAIFALPATTSGSYILPNVTHTYSKQVSPDGRDTWVWHYILAVSLPAPFLLPCTDLGPAYNASAAGYAVFDTFNPSGGALGLCGGGGRGGGGGGLPTSYTIPTGTGLPSPPSGAHDLRYLLIAPILPGGWVLLGEMGKFVPMSGARTGGVTAVGGGPRGAGFTATITAAPTGEGEDVTFFVLPPPPATAPLLVACDMHGAGSATLACYTTGGCACARPKHVG